MLVNEDKARHAPAVNKESSQALLWNQRAKPAQVTGSAAKTEPVLRQERICSDSKTIK